jgi:16S rRNA (guanine966-N2)-methyltransferase
VREAVFNSLRSLDVVEGARVLDLYAGTGAMGIEALSRGASHCVFVERDRDALAVLKKNISALGLSDRSTVLAVDAMTVAARQPDIDLLIADPPYGFTQWRELIVDADAAVVVLESDRAVGEIEGWDTIREKKYGRTHVAFLQPAEASDGTVEGE